MNIQVAAVIAAAGSSVRMGGIKKEFRLLPSKNKTSINECEDGEPLTVLGSAVRSFAASPRIGLIVIAIPAGAEEAARQALTRELKKIDIREKILFVTGGPDRRSSVYNALNLLEKYNPCWVLIHDGARPWIKTGLIENTIDAVIQHKAVIPLLPITETPKQVDFSNSINAAGYITGHLNRNQIGIAQTPQAFAFPEILLAHKKAAEYVETEYTDDAQIWGEFIGPVAFIRGDPENRKITFPEDLKF